jgi:hypothetical protein
MKAKLLVVAMSANAAICFTSGSGTSNYRFGELLV